MWMLGEFFNGILSGFGPFPIDVYTHFMQAPRTEGCFRSPLVFVSISPPSFCASTESDFFGISNVTKEVLARIGREFFGRPGLKTKPSPKPLAHPPVCLNLIPPLALAPWPVWLNLAQANVMGR